MDKGALARMNDSRRRTAAVLPWLLPLVLLGLVVAIAFVPGWVIGLIGVLVFGILGYGGVVWYSRRYRQFRTPDDHQ